MHSTIDIQAMATASQIAQAIAPELPTLVNATITSVVRIGFTRNAAATPYIVYKIGERKCCTFIKKRLFLNLVVTMMSKYYKSPERLNGIPSCIPRLCTHRRG